jgi:hypothetical protein
MFSNRFRWTEDDQEYKRALDEDLAIARRRMGKDGGLSSVYQERDQMRAHGSTEHGPRDYLSDLDRIALGGGETMGRVAADYTAIAGEIVERCKGVPRVVKQGDVLVPVAYDFRVRPLVDEQTLGHREANAQAAAIDRHARPGTISTTRQCLAMYTHAQQSDVGIGMRFMTKSERALASREWSAQLRAKVKASDNARKQAERMRVLVDVQDIE